MTWAELKWITFYFSVAYRQHFVTTHFYKPQVPSESLFLSTAGPSFWNNRDCLAGGGYRFCLDGLTQADTKTMILWHKLFVWIQCNSHMRPSHVMRIWQNHSCRYLWFAWQCDDTDRCLYASGCLSTIGYLFLQIILLTCQNSFRWQLIRK